MPRSSAANGTAHLALILLFSAGGAQAAPVLTPYVGAAIGASGAGRLGASGTDYLLGPFTVSEKVKSGWIGSGLVGAHVRGMPLSVEAEGIYVRNGVASPDLDAAFGAPLSIKTRTKAVLFNLKLATPEVYDVGPISLRPYVAGGFGYGDTSITIVGDDYKGHGQTWQGKAGIEFKASEKVTFDLDYRYLKLPSFYRDSLGLAADYKAHIQAISLGVNWRLGRP